MVTQGNDAEAQQSVSSCFYVLPAPCCVSNVSHISLMPEEQWNQDLHWSFIIIIAFFNLILFTYFRMAASKLKSGQINILL